MTTAAATDPSEKPVAMPERRASFECDPRRGPRQRVGWLLTTALSALAWAAPGRAESPATAVRADAIPADFSTFEADCGGEVAAKLGTTPKHWRQIAPAVHHLATQHADTLATMGEADRLTALVALARFIDSKREAAAALPVLADGRTVIGLLDPAHGLGPREITAIADAYGCESTIFKLQAPDETLAGVAAEFLAAITAAVRAGKPTSVVVLGHGLPTEIQSYHIRFERLAAALLDGAAGGGAIDLADVVIICDDCFSADFHINLLAELTREAGRRGRQLASLPVCIAGTNRACVGHADVGEKFVPHFCENVDNMMYGYGRAPLVEGGRVAGYRLVDPELVQDPVVFVPLAEADLATLRGILGLPADEELPRWLDVG